MRTLGILVAVLVTGCKQEPPTAPPPVPPPVATTIDAAAATATPDPTTPNELITRGSPAVPRMNVGVPRADRAIAGQVELLRGLLFPTSPVMLDTDVGDQWPANPVVYGGPHVNALVARIAPCLPFELAAGHLALGGAVYDRDDVVVVTVVPAHARDASCPGHPAFLLYAGTGTPGVGEINSGSVTGGGAYPIVVADAFGPLTTGRWNGATAEMAASAPRPQWPHVAREQAGIVVTFHGPDQAAIAEPVVAASLRGVQRVVDRNGLDGAGLAIAIYLHPDRETKKRATGSAGDGNAIGFARTLHVVANIKLTSLETLVAHEATHILLAQAWGQAGSPLLGEGVAVWTSGQYRGLTLDQWNAKLDRAPVIIELLGKKFLATPELETYPAAGLLVRAIVDKFGIAVVRDHLFGASILSWDDAARSAGTTPAELQAAYDALVAN